MTAKSEKPAAKAARSAGDVYGEQSAKVEKLMTEGKNRFDKLSQDAARTGREQVEAWVESGSVFVRGAEEFVKTYTALAQESAERNAQGFKTLLSSKTLNEYTEAQNSLAQQNFDDFMEGFTKLSELGVRLATEAFEPLNDQFSKSLRKATDSLAA